MLGALLVVVDDYLRTAVELELGTNGIRGRVGGGAGAGHAK